MKIGDMVAWDSVPSGAMVKHGCAEEFDPVDYMVRHNDGGWNVGSCGIPGCDDSWVAFGVPHDSKGIHLGPWGWNGGDGGTVQIVALNLTGQESANDLRALAEAFETSRGA